MLMDKPGVSHKKGSNFAFADGHAETHQWLDPRTITAPRDPKVLPGNRDLVWLQGHSTWRPWKQGWSLPRFWIP